MSRRKPLSELSKRHVRRLVANKIDVEQNDPITESPTCSYSCEGFQPEQDPPTQNSVTNDFIDCMGLEICENNVENLESNTHLKSDPLTQCTNTKNQETNDLFVSSEDIKSKLVDWALDCNINLTHCTQLLRILRTHECFSALPCDARTLLNTCRITTDVVSMTPGHYIHFGLEKGIKLLIEFYGEDSVHNEINLTLNIDGLPLFKSSPFSFWPILASFDSYNEIFIIGVYYGESKPYLVTEFLLPFVEEYIKLGNDQISVNTKTFTIKIKNIVCDAPAKSYILNVKGHSGYSSCTKCKIEGIYKNNRVCFPATQVSTLRTDQEFRQKSDDDFHLPGLSPLITIPDIDIIKDTPYDYMHLICLGVVKKLLLLWQAGSLKYRLPHQKIEHMSQELLKLRKYTPSEFCRKPRSLKYVKYWNATEFRQFLLYTGFRVLSQVVSKDILLNFLSLVVGIRILCQKNIDTNMLDYADELLKYFVKTFKVIYGEHQMSHNIHGILHIKGDVIRHGSLDSYSCFKFENYMQKLKSHIRKPEKPLQQLKKRYDETCSRFNQKKKTVSASEYKVFDKKFRKGTCNGYAINVQSVADCIFSVKVTEDIIKVLNIVEKDDKIYVICQNFQTKQDLFLSPCDSSLVGIYFISQINPIKSMYLLEDLDQKYYLMPYKKNNVDGFIISALLHKD